MEPGRDDREQGELRRVDPVVVTAAMEPPHTGGVSTAAMEPGRDDREHIDLFSMYGLRSLAPPQWSPAGMTGNTARWLPVPTRHDGAAMEPGRDDREHAALDFASLTVEDAPQWSPAGMTGNTSGATPARRTRPSWPQRSPAGMTANTAFGRVVVGPLGPAAMEPGRDDREHNTRRPVAVPLRVVAAMEPGRDDREHPDRHVDLHTEPRRAAMEPGRDDREHHAAGEVADETLPRAAMEPGRDDREHRLFPRWRGSHTGRRNGARPG